MAESFIVWNYIPPFLKSPFPLKQSWKVGSLGFSRVKNKAGVQGFHSMVERGPAEHQANFSSSVHCVWGPCGREPRGRMRECDSPTPCSKSPKRAKGSREGSPFIQEFMYLRVHTLAVATPGLASGLLLGVMSSRLPWACI